MMKDILVSLAVGAGAVLVLFSLTETGIGSVANAFVYPGALLASLAGLGAHDMGGLALYVFGNMALYAALALLLIRAVKAARALS